VVASPRQQVRDDERSQALTLEAVTGAILLLVAVGFALQITAVTPLSASTSSQHLENQLQSSTEGILTSTAETGGLHSSVLYWNESKAKFENASGASYYRSGPPDNEFGEALANSFSDRNIAYNVVVYYQTPAGEQRSQRMIYQGEPSDHAVSASRTVLLQDTDNLTASTPIEVQSASSFYAPDSAPGERFYNVVRVEVIAWRI
jgi:hypothetical protein